MKSRNTTTLFTISLILLLSVSFVDLFEEIAEVSSNSQCLPGQFECRYSHECIPIGWLCDGENDCGLASVKRATITPNNNTQKRQTQIGDNSEKILATLVENGEELEEEEPGMVQQLDTSDEDFIHCNQSTVCARNYFRCANLFSCVHFDKVCNNVADCPDGSDELEFCANISACAELKCDYRCKPIPKGAECFCKDGDQWNGTSCVGIDRCSFEEQCEQICRNTESSFRCDCHQGYRLVNSTKCVAINVPFQLEPLLSFSTPNSLQFIRLDGSTFSKIPLITSPHASSSNSNQSQSPPPPPIDMISYDLNFSNSSFCYRISHHNSISTIDSDNLLIATDRLPNDRTLSNNNIECSGFSLLTNDKDGPQPKWSYSIKSRFYSSLRINQLSFEWISGNWYMLNGDYELIFACNRTFDVCVNIADVGLIRPIMFALDPNTGSLFYTQVGFGLDNIWYFGTLKVYLLGFYWERHKGLYVGSPIGF